MGGLWRPQQNVPAPATADARPDCGRRVRESHSRAPVLPPISRTARDPSFRSGDAADLPCQELDVDGRTSCTVLVPTRSSSSSLIDVCPASCLVPVSTANRLAPRQSMLTEPGRPSPCRIDSTPGQPCKYCRLASEGQSPSNPDGQQDE